MSNVKQQEVNLVIVDLNFDFFSAIKDKSEWNLIGRRWPVGCLVSPLSQEDLDAPPFSRICRAHGLLHVARLKGLYRPCTLISYPILWYLVSLNFHQTSIYANV